MFVMDYFMSYIYRGTIFFYTFLYNLNCPINARTKTSRGFCAGVDRAIEIVKKSIEKYGAPVYVRHEIVHNKHVVDGLKKIGAVFVEEIDEIEDKTRPVIFSAHELKR